MRMKSTDAYGPRRRVQRESCYHGADLSKPEQVREMVAAATRNSALSTFLSTTPASSTSRRSRICGRAVGRGDCNQSRRTSTRSGRAPADENATGVASSTSHRCTDWSLRWRKQPISRRNTAWSAHEVVALENATTGITCNAICPGWVLTPLVQKQIDDRAAKEGIAVERAKLELLAEKQPSHEFATPEQIGALTVFLCSDAAAQIRGAALPVDGGWLAQ